jgi:hypothetical protein
VDFTDIPTGCGGCEGLSSFGLGAGGAINLSEHFAIDGDFAITRSSSVASNLYGGRHSEYLLGPAG